MKRSKKVGQNERRKSQPIIGKNETGSRNSPRKSTWVSRTEGSDLPEKKRDQKRMSGISHHEKEVALYGIRGSWS